MGICGYEWWGREKCGIFSRMGGTIPFANFASYFFPLVLLRLVNEMISFDQIAQFHGSTWQCAETFYTNSSVNCSELIGWQMFAVVPIFSKSLIVRMLSVAISNYNSAFSLRQSNEIHQTVYSLWYLLVYHLCNHN